MKMFNARDGFQGWVWPALITLGALTERALAGFGIGKFFDLAPGSAGFWSTLLGISLAGTLGNKAHRRWMESKTSPPVVG